MDVIATHVNADFDCLGSMIAAKRLYPDAVLVFPGGQERGLRDFLLQSTLYAYDVKGIRDIDLDHIDRLILVDVRSAARIGELARIVDRPGLELHIYDHHPAGDDALRGQVENIHQVGATTTIMTRIFKERGIVPTADEATMMMLGLYEDTGHLLFSGTTAEDFLAAAFLLEHGANLNLVADFLVREMTSEQVGLLNQLLQSCQKMHIGGVEIAIASASIDSYIGDISSLVHKLKDMENLDVLIVAVRMEDRIFLIGRSRIAAVHVGELMREFGGGGHAFAASATVRDLPLAQLLEQLEKLLPRFVQSRFEARDLMSQPVKSIDAAATIEEARDLMARFDFNTLPVLGRLQDVVGIITRQVAEKAIFHKLLKLPVSELMNSDVQTVSPDTALEVLQQAIIDHNQRCIPIVDKGQLVGIVTRTDLLRQILGQGRFSRSEQESEHSQALQLKRRNLSRLLSARMPQYYKLLLRQLGAVADNLGVRIYLVGGVVRDLLLRQENLDIDLVVEGDGIAYAKAFAATVPCRVRAHEKFSTAVIVLADGFKIDVASARLEYYDSPAALPNVEYASIRHDLYRRDFTMNTLIISLNRDNYGELLDFFGGQRDLKDRSIRVLHNLSFIEDPTRLFRAVRFEQRLAFRIGRQTERLMRSAVRINLVKKVGGARLMNELVQILDEPQVVPALERLAQFDLLQGIDPHLHFDQHTEKLLSAAQKACNWFDLLYTGEKYQRWLVYLLCLCDQLSDKRVRRIIQRLDIQVKYQQLLINQRARGRTLLKNFTQRRNDSPPPLNSQIYHWFTGFHFELIIYLMARSETDSMRQWISIFVTRLKRTDIALTGDDLKGLGLPPGPEYQKVFSVLLDARLNGEVHSQDDEIALVKQLFPAALPTAAETDRRTR